MIRNRITKGPTNVTIRSTLRLMVGATFLGCILVFVVLIGSVTGFVYPQMQYERITKGAFEKVPVLLDAREIFGMNEVHSSISYFNGRCGKTTWNSRILIYERYELSISFEFDYRGFEITAIKPPKITLSELRSIMVSSAKSKSERTVEIRYNNQFHKTISAEDWHALVHSGGDFSKIGIALKCDSPIKNTGYLPWKRWPQETGIAPRSLAKEEDEMD